MRRIFSLAALAALATLGCSQESAQTPAADVEIWQEELPIRQPWLRDQLPDQSLVYMRIPNILGLLTMPKGNMLDSALRSTANVENVEKIRQGLINNVLGDIPAITDAKLDLFNEYIRSPIEVSGIFIPAPTSLIAVTLDIESNDAFEALLQEVGFALAAPLDGDGVGEIQGLGMPVFVRFEASTGRLLMQTGPGANATAFAKALESLQRSGPHRMRAMENKIDASGQGFFLWLDAQEAMPLMQMFMPRDQLEELIDLGLEEVDAAAMGWGAADGKGRLAVIADMPSNKERGFIPYVNNDLSATSVGNPDGLLLLSIPTVEEFSRLETLALETSPPDSRNDWQEGKAFIQDKVGVSVEEFFASLGPEVFVILDDAGDYLAIRLRDAALWDDVLARIEATTGHAPDSRQFGGETIYHWALPNPAASVDPTTIGEDLGLFFTLWGRQTDHFYWYREGDFLYMASIPQVLMDRIAMPARTDIAEWVHDTQRVDASSAVVLLAGTNRKLPKRLYGFYIEVLQLLSDVALADMDVWSMPTAEQLALPDEGTIAFTVSLGNPTLGMEFTFENNPIEMAGSMTGVALVGILAAIAIPAYEDYSTRAEISEGLSLASGAKAGVTEYYQQNGRFPDADVAAQLSLSDAVGNYTEAVTVQPGNGWIIIDYYYAVANTGGQLILVPTVEADDRISWSCSGTFENKHLPAACRE